MTGTETAVAIYWDFENVHACLMDDAGGDGSYRATAKFKAQDVVIDVARVVEYAASLGRVAIHRAYANWQFFGKYKDELQAHAIDLVQMFPLSGAKNGADIRLALDAVGDLQYHPEITHVVVVASDSDYTALAQRCRTFGRYFVGIGTVRTARGYPAACDEFRRYHDLPASARFTPPAVARTAPAGPAVPAMADGPQRDSGTLEGAADLVVAALRRLAADAGDNWVLKATVRPMVKRLDPVFDESALGFAAFSDLVTALDGRIAERIGRFDHELAVRADLPEHSADAAAESLAAFDPLAPPTPATLIELLLKRKKQRLPADRRLLWTGPELVAGIFAAAPEGIEPGFDSLWLKFEAAAAALGIAVSEAEFRKLKAILWRAHAFEPLGFDLGLRLRSADADALRLRTVAALLRLLPDPAGTDPAVLTEALFGQDATVEQHELIRAALTVLADQPGEALAGQSCGTLDPGDVIDPDDVFDPDPEFACADVLRPGTGAPEPRAA